MDRLYSVPSWQLAITLFVILLGGMFGGFLLGKDAARRGEQEATGGRFRSKGGSGWLSGIAACVLVFVGSE